MRRTSARRPDIKKTTCETAREKLGVTPKKEGFGPTGKWVWVPTGGATVLKLVVDNPANGPTAAEMDPGNRIPCPSFKKVEDGSR